MRLLFISGPALGHISRLLTVATKCRDAFASEILFAVPSVSKNINVISESDFEFKLIVVEKENRHIDFSEKTECLIDDYSPDLIVVDWNMLNWGSCIDWPKVPRVLVTNFF